MKQDLNIFYHVCVFRADRRNKIANPAYDWLRHFLLLLWKHRMEFNKIWQGARSQRPLISLCFSGRSEEQDGRPASDLPRHFRLLPRDSWTRFNETWQEARSKCPLPIVCYSGRSKKAVLASGWLRHFRLLLCDRWTEFNETLQEAKFKRPLPSSCYSTKLDRKQDINVLYKVCVFSGRSEKQDGRPGLWLAETFSTSPLNGIQQNLIGNKIYQRHLPSLCFSGWSEKHCTHV